MKSISNLLRTSMVGEGTPPTDSDFVRIHAAAYLEPVVSTWSTSLEVAAAAAITLSRDVVAAAARPVLAQARAALIPSVPQPVAVICEDDRKSVQECLEALFALLEVYGFRSRRHDPTSKRAFDKTVNRWVEASAMLGVGGWMKWAKYKFATYFYHNTRQHDTAPENPLPIFVDNPSKLVRGSAARFMKTLLAGKHRHTMLASILQVKKGCPRPSETMVQAAVAKAQAALTVVHPTPKNEWLLEWADIRDSYDEVYLSRANMEVQLKRTVRDVFTRQTYTDKDRARLILPSGSASYRTNKANGGKLNEISDYLHRSGKVFRNPNAFNMIPPSWDDDEKADEHVAKWMVTLRELARLQHTLSKEAYTKIYYEKYWARPNKASVKLKLLHILSEEDEYIGKGNRTYEVDLRQIEETSLALYEHMLEIATREPSNVLCIGLAESLKVRVITAGSAMKTKVLHNLQKFMWSALQKHKTFELTGKPVDAWIVQDRLGAKLLPGEFYLSGDYSAATDNLAPWVSECIGLAISECINLSKTEEDLLIENLTGNQIDMALERKDAGHELKPQRWGQLMGSIVSFPILCIANAAMCRWAIELERGRKTSLADSGLLINGDDVVFKTTLQGHALWKKITAFGGLESSVGKTFLSEEFAQINSINFRRLSEPVVTPFYTIEKGDYTRNLWFEQTPFINLGLLFGMKRSGEKVGRDAIADTRDTLGARCRDLISCAPLEVRYPLMQLFIKHHQKLLDSVKVPRYVPEQWGGIGLPTVASPAEMLSGEDPKFGPTLLDRKVAQRIGEMPRLPNGQLRYPVGQPLGDAPWETHKLVLQRLPELSYGYPTQSEKAQYQVVYGALVYDCLLRDDVLRDHARINQQIDFDKALRKGEKPPSTYVPKSQRVLKQNDSSWVAARVDGNLPTRPARASTLFSRDSPKAFLPVTIVSHYTRVGRYEPILFDDLADVFEAMAW